MSTNEKKVLSEKRAQQIYNRIQSVLIEEGAKTMIEEQKCTGLILIFFDKDEAAFSDAIGRVNFKVAQILLGQYAKLLEKGAKQHGTTA